MTAVLIVVVAAVVVIAAVVLVVRARRSRHSDGVATFRRQIDALSPEARRPVVDKVQRARGGGRRAARRATRGPGLVARDLAIDLGTANTLVYMKGRGIVLNEPSVIALNRQTGEVLATGREAWQMIGRTPGYIVAVRPLRGGAITDFEITERMIRLLLQRVGVSRFTRPKVVICVPSAITEVERRAVTDAAPGVPAPPTPTSSSSRWRRRSAPTCRSTSRSATWSSTSAAARARPPSSASVASSPSRRSASVRSTSTRRSRTTCGASTASPSASGRPRRSRSPSARPIRPRTRTRPRSAGAT